MPFVKLDCGILDSSVWMDREAREVWVTALAMAVPVELLEPAAVYRADVLELDGWSVPPGWYGMVEAAGPGIVRNAMAVVSRGPGLTVEQGLDALMTLCSPDPNSRSPEFEGRRLARVKGGYIVLNYDQYKLKDHGNADRCRRYRERKKALAEQRHALRVDDRHVVTCRNMQAEAEAEAEAEADLQKGERGGGGAGGQQGLDGIPPSPSKPAKPKPGECSDEQWNAVASAYEACRTSAGLPVGWGPKDVPSNRKLAARAFAEGATPEDWRAVMLHRADEMKRGDDAKWSGLVHVVRHWESNRMAAAAKAGGGPKVTQPVRRAEGVIPSSFPRPG